LLELLGQVGSGFIPEDFGDFLDGLGGVNQQFLRFLDAGVEAMLAKRDACARIKLCRRWEYPTLNSAAKADKFNGS
jgi:hypothetical protein